MTSENTSRSKSTSKFSRPIHEKKALRAIQSIQSEVLAPIYDKVQLLRREMLSKQPQKNLLIQEELVKPEVNQQFLELGVDRDGEIQKQRKLHDSQGVGEKSKKSTEKKKLAHTGSDWRLSRRNKTKSLVNFLQNNKNLPNKAGQPGTERVKSPGSVIEKEAEDEQLFEPVGRLYQESLRGSQSRTLSSLRPDSSLHMSKIGSASSRDSPRKYLRKGTRVRQILMRQLQSADQRSGTPSSMTYLRQYDQWVPTTLVEEKRAELQAFMNIMYGDKRDKASNLVDLNQINLVYL